MQVNQTSKRRRVMFLSWRWRIVIPLFVVILLIAMMGAYVLASLLGRGISVSQDNILLESVRAVANRSDTLYQHHFQEAQRVAFTVGIPEAVSLDQVDVLQDSLEALARVGELDVLILTDENGVEVFGVQRVNIPDVDDYAVNTGTDLSANPMVLTAMRGERGESGLFRTPEGLILGVTSPLLIDDGLVGTVLVGNHLSTAVEELRGSAVAEIAAYDDIGRLIETTFELNDALRADLEVDSAFMQQALSTDGLRVPIRSQSITNTAYRMAIAPLNYGENTLGAVAVLLPDSVPFATEIGRQLTGLLAAAITGAAIIVVFAGLAFFTGRVERVQQTAEALARGEQDARTKLKPTDEAGAAGAALDRYARRVQEEQDALQQNLRRQRRETNHMIAVLESIPDGVIVQDQEGRVTLMNDRARELIGSQRVLRQNATLQELSSVVSAVLGTQLAPGIYTLGDPQRVSVDDRMLNAQAAAITSVADERIGTVIVLRDITDFVRKEQERERLLQAVEEQIQIPAGDLMDSSPMDHFAREITKRAVALQKLVVEMRELTEIDVRELQESQKPIRVDTLLWTVANEWRQIVTAAELQLKVMVDKPGLYVLGDEKRLRWAIGNMMDNAVKYTPPGGVVTLEIHEERDNQVTMRVRDTGVGIESDEVKKVTTRFYRGNPTMKTGEIIRTPGMGQGLYVAQHIIEAHGGALKVKTQQHVGTAIYFSLPLTSAVAMDLPLIHESFEGETVKLPEDYMQDLEL